MAIEADAVVGFGGVWRLKGGGLADVVEEHAPGERGGGGGGQVIEEHEGVDPNVALGVVLGGLLDALHAGELGEDLGEEPGGVEELEGAARVAFGEHAGEFFANALLRDQLNFRG